MKVLVVVDMQNDFIDGSLGTAEAVAIVPAVKEKIESLGEKDIVLFTKDTHMIDYMYTQEGKNLPVEHCMVGTDGWMIRDELQPFSTDENTICKPCFGSLALMEKCIEINQTENIELIEFVGLCTDICVISNALIVKSALPEVKISVAANCCAGVTPESHKTALEAMKMCQIEITGE